MTENDLKQLKSELWTLRREIVERRQNLGENRQALSEPESEIVERGQNAEMDEPYDQLDQQGLVQVEEIDRALSKIDEGTYGICEDCGKAIPVERLRALPATRYCVRHSLGQEAG